jgi:uncharacterized flavoprotein (TIGR03862 family)
LIFLDKIRINSYIGTHESDTAEKLSKHAFSTTKLKKRTKGQAKEMTQKVMEHNKKPQKTIAIIGGGPAGLMAAETLAGAGHAVTVYERKPSVGRKFLMAGRGGLNITHSEDIAAFTARYGPAAPFMAPLLDRFSPATMREWCAGLGQNTFIGTSGRVFPESFKASPLLRAWLARLEGTGVTFALHHQWVGWHADGDLIFSTADGSQKTVRADATLLALGGGSWVKLGSDGGWVDLLKSRHIPLAPLQPSNCGFAVSWSPVFREKFAGQPLKTITITFAEKTIPGEIMIAQNGIEGGAVYALSAALRNHIATHGNATITIDLRPGLDERTLMGKLQNPRGSQSFSTWLKKSLSLPPVAINLLREIDPDIAARSPAALARTIKALPLCLTAPFPIDRAISSAGGIGLDALDRNMMLTAIPGVFAAGEMLDWEAPTGGYLLQGCFATGIAAAHGIQRWIDGQ